MSSSSIVGLRGAGRASVRAHPRENREVTSATLDPRPGAEPGLWEQVRGHLGRLRRRCDPRRSPRGGPSAAGAWAS